MSATRTKPAKSPAKSRTQSNAKKPSAASAAVSSGARRQPREGSTMWAVMKVLEGKRKPMTAIEIHAEIAQRKLATGLRGKTPSRPSPRRWRSMPRGASTTSTAGGAAAKPEESAENTKKPAAQKPEKPAVEKPEKPTPEK